MTRTFRAVLLLLAGAFAGCSPPESESPAESGDRNLSTPYQAVATIGMIADVVRHVAGDRAQVTTLIGEGIDPHLHSPTRADVVAIDQADIVFYNGLMLEGKMAEILKRANHPDRPVYAIAECILEQGDFVMRDRSDRYDPHLWMNVAGWMKATSIIVETLSEFDPDNAGNYRNNGAAYLKELERLRDYVQLSFATIPPQQRVLITAHDAFGYLGKVHGIEVRGIQGLSTESAAGVRDIEALIEYMISRRIPAVFVETSISDQNVRALIEGAAAKGHALTIGGTLYSDAMGPRGTYEGTYIGMIDHNVTAITRALGGQAPENGMNGRLRPKTP